MSANDECTGSKRRIPAVVVKIAAIAVGAAGVVLVFGPATATVTVDGLALHQAAVGGGLIGLSGLMLAMGCQRGEAVLKPIPAEKVRAIAEERRKEAQHIIATAARRKDDLKPLA